MPRLSARRTRLCPTGTVVPESEVSGCRPHDDRAGDQPDDAHGEHGGGHVGEGGKRLAGEDLASVERAGEDRLEGAVVGLRGDDVAGDERRDQRQAPDGEEEEDDERSGEAGVAQGSSERDVCRPGAFLEREGDDERDRDEDGGAEAEVGALLDRELDELPAVDGRDAGHQRGLFLGLR